MNERAKKIPRWLIAIAAIIIGVSLILYYAVSLMIPSGAVQRAAITAGGGNTVNIDGFDIWYTLYNEESRETPVIVVAGGGALSSDYMEESLRFLADTHPVLFFDSRGCGRSQIKPDLADYSVPIFSEGIEALRAHFFPDRNIIVVAHSFGGLVAMDYAANYAERVEKLILISSVSADYKPVMTTAYFKAGLPPRDQSAANEWYVQNMDVFFGPYFQNTSAKAILDKTMASYAVMMHVGKSKLDLTPKIKNITMPVLLLVGGEKEYPITGMDVARKLKSLLPNARLEQLVHSGHFMFAEENDEFQQLVNQFLIDKPIVR